MFDMAVGSAERHPTLVHMLVCSWNVAMLFRGRAVGNGRLFGGIQMRRLRTKQSCKCSVVRQQETQCMHRQTPKEDEEGVGRHTQLLQKSIRL